MKVGDRYGEWEIIGEASKPYHSLCRCSCGRVKEVNNSTLRLGKSKSCGHVVVERNLKNLKKRSDERILGRRFGRLTAIERVDEPGSARYICKCDCGNEVTVKATLLLTGRTKSCGCYKSENAFQLMESIKEKGFRAIESQRYDGTVISSLNQKINKNNKTGYKGVSKMKDGRYRAYIFLRRKQKHLGVFDTAEEANEARKKAEEELFQPIIDRFNEEENRDPEE